MNRYFSGKDTLVVNQHIKKMLNIIGKAKIKTVVEFHTYQDV